MDIAFEVIAEGLAFPEGPVALQDGSVLFVEILGGTLKRAWGDGRVEVIANLGGGPNGAQMGPDGAVYICNNGGLDLERMCHASGPGAKGRIERVDLTTGKADRLYESCGDFPLNAPNDLVFDAQGGLWFTDMGKNLPRRSDRSGLYYCQPDGSGIMEAHFGGLSYNGIGLSRDEKTLFVADTHSARLWRFELDAPGRLAESSVRSSGRRVYVATAPGDVMLDSLALTKSGKVCVGTLGNGGITVFDVDGSSEHLALPDHTVTNIAFGGADMRTAYITLAGTGRLIRCRWPEPGLELNFSR
ncbi:MAG TPA: SMP-30/gluconolactonase/LRE family protein [Caulobacteraceae bacterium]|jgi:gluconolactonase